MNNSTMRNKNNIREEEPSEHPLIDVWSSGEEQAVQNSPLPNYNNGEMVHENGKEFGYQEKSKWKETYDWMYENNFLDKELEIENLYYTKYSN